MTDALVQMSGVGKQFTVRRGGLIARRELVSVLDDINISIQRGQAFGLIGESGSGKSTVARLLLKLLVPSQGQVFYRGRDIAELQSGEERDYRRRVQMIFQDSGASFNPRRIVGDQIIRAVRRLGVEANRRSARERVVTTLERVGLRADHLQRYPHEFSGGQRQRLGIARALALEPEFLILDEPTSALDVSIQAQILNLLVDLRADLGLTYLFIGHDLSIVEFFCDEVAVMLTGRIVEQADSERLFRDAAHPATRALLDSMLSLEPVNG